MRGYTGRTTTNVERDTKWLNGINYIDCKNIIKAIGPLTGRTSVADASQAMRRPRWQARPAGLLRDTKKRVCGYFVYIALQASSRALVCIRCVCLRTLKRRVPAGPAILTSVFPNSDYHSFRRQNLHHRRNEPTTSRRFEYRQDGIDDHTGTPYRQPPLTVVVRATKTVGRPPSQHSVYRTGHREH